MYSAVLVLVAKTLLFSADVAGKWTASDPVQGGDEIKFSRDVAIAADEVFVAKRAE